jgi:hypothetical protein
MSSEGRQIWTETVRSETVAVPWVDLARAAIQHCKRNFWIVVLTALSGNRRLRCRRWRSARSLVPTSRSIS